MQLVLINFKDKSYTVYKDRVVLAHFILEEDSTLTKEEVEELRVASYNERA